MSEEKECLEDGKEIFLLFGYSEGAPPYSDVLGVFSTFEKALEKLTKKESKKKNYICWSCDTKGIKVSDIDFQNKTCPNCGDELEYDLIYDKYTINKYKIDGYWFDNKTLYEMRYDEAEKAIAERFRARGEFTYRKPNIKMDIIYENLLNYNKVRKNELSGRFRI